MISTKHPPEKVVVVGGGIAGTYTAILLAKAGYDVTILEKENHLHATTSLGARVVHTSAWEYIRSEGEQTVHDTLEGALFSKVLFPREVFGRMPVRGALSNEAVKRGFSTTEQYSAHVDRARKVYSALHRQYDQQFPRRASRDLFGHPDDFIREIDVGKEQQAGRLRNVTKAYQGRDMTINTPQFAAWIGDQLRKHGVHVLTDQDVKEEGIRKIGNDQYVITTEKHSFQANHVVVAAGALSASVLHGHDDTHMPAIQKRIHMTLLVSFKKPRKDFSTTLTFGGVEGGMLAYIDPYHAFLYAPTDTPGTANKDAGNTNSHFLDNLRSPDAAKHIRILDKVVANANAMRPDAPLGSGNHYEPFVAQLHKIYPDVDYTNIESIQPFFGCVTTRDKNIQNRPHIKPEVLDGILLLNPPKWTDAGKAALQAVQLIQERSIATGAIKPNQLWFAPKSDITIRNIPPDVIKLKKDTAVLKKPKHIKETQDRLQLPLALDYSATSAIHADKGIV